MSRPETVAGPIGAASHLSIDLDALAGNWRLLRDAAPGAECGAAVKADAYGVGLARVAPALAAAGCRSFFVAHVGEAIELRALLPEARIFQLHGPIGRETADLAAHNIVPVLNDLGQIGRWRDEVGRQGRALAAAIHIDTGMNRLGLPAGELDRIVAEPDLLAGVGIACWMSHLATADEPARPEASQQLDRFRAAIARLPAAPRSLANSAAILLGPDFAFDLTRPGIGLYGGNPFSDRANPMAEVVRLRAGILQVRQIDAPGSVGYGATHSVAPGTRIATIAAGYADGVLRAAGRPGIAMVGGVKVPIVGRVSMDLITLDVTEVPEADARPGALVDLIGGDLDIDGVAVRAGTISFELLTGLGARYARHYLGGV